MSTLLKKIRPIAALLVLCALLCACAFAPPRGVPAYFRTLYINTLNPYSSFMTELINRLRAVDVRFVPKPQWAQYQLDIGQVQLLGGNHGVTSTTTASTVPVTQTVTVRILTYHHKQVVPPRTFSATQSMILNTNQILHSNTPAPAIRLLSRELVSQIYDWLVSTNVQAQIHAYEMKASKKTHAHQR